MSRCVYRPSAGRRRQLKIRAPKPSGRVSSSPPRELYGVPSVKSLVSWTMSIASDRACNGCAVLSKRRSDNRSRPRRLLRPRPAESSSFDPLRGDGSHRRGQTVDPWVAVLVYARVDFTRQKSRRLPPPLSSTARDSSNVEIRTFYGCFSFPPSTRGCGVTRFYALSALLHALPRTFRNALLTYRSAMLGGVGEQSTESLSLSFPSLLLPLTPLYLSLCFSALTISGPFNPGLAILTGSDRDSRTTRYAAHIRELCNLVTY